MDSVVENAHSFLRGHTRGELQFEEHLRPIKYVVAPSGRLVSPVMVAMLTAVETVLFVPECRDDTMEVLVSIEELEETGADGALTDRWRIYHGEPEDVRWAFLDPDAVRFEGHIVDGETLVRPNPLAEAEPSLCRRLNESGATVLRELCRQLADVEVEQPVVVGVDPDGIDVRRRFDVVRLPASEPMTTADDARHAIERMLGEHAAG